MPNSNLLTLRAAALAAAITLPAAAHAQATWNYTDWDSDQNMELTDREFGEGLTRSGVYSAWDRDDTPGLSNREFATGMYSAWDMDNDRQISEQEFNTGSERWYGPDYDRSFADFDADSSGFVDTNEFGTAWNNDYYTGWDANSDSLLDENEFNTGVYDTVNLDDDQVITIEEEGWFEGWFDGDDIEAEVQDIGDVF